MDVPTVYPPEDTTVSPEQLVALARAEWSRQGDAVAASLDGLCRVMSAAIDVMGAMARLFRPLARHVALADHRRRQDARRVQAKAARRERTGRWVTAA